MAFKKVTAISEAISIDAKNKSFEGILRGLKTLTIGKGKSARESEIFIFETPEGLQEVWGSGAINACLIDRETGKLNEVFLNCPVRLTYKGMKKLDGKPQPMRLIEVEADTDARDPKRGKSYILNPSKKFQKKA